MLYPRESPFLINWLPSYAARGTEVVLNRETLEKGVMQKKALSYFLWVADHCHRDNIKDAFRYLVDVCGGVSATIAKDESQIDNFLNATLALALMEDITQLVPYIENDRAPLGQISGLIADFMPGCKVDVLKQFENKGSLSLKTLCMLYGVKDEDLAIKVVADDSVKGMKLFQLENPQLIDKALARFPYDPLTQIRTHLQHEPGYISYQEFSDRFQKQVSLLKKNGYMPLINPRQPCEFNARGRIEASFIETADHQLRILPQYLATLKAYATPLLDTFGAYARQAWPLSEEQAGLIKRTIEEFERAGVCEMDILVMGILNFDGTSKGDHGLLSLDEKAEMLPRLLLEKGVEFADKPNGSQVGPMSYQVGLMIKKMPSEMLEPLCSDSRHWHLLYRATGDQKYLPLLKDRIERVFAEDLGL